MNRAEFFKKACLGIAAIVSAPTILAKTSPAEEKVQFTDRRDLYGKRGDFKWLKAEKFREDMDRAYLYGEHWSSVELGEIQMREYKTPHGTLRMIGGNNESIRRLERGS